MKFASKDSAKSLIKTDAQTFLSFDCVDFTIQLSTFNSQLFTDEK